MDAFQDLLVAIKATCQQWRDRQHELDEVTKKLAEHSRAAVDQSRQLLARTELQIRGWSQTCPLPTSGPPATRPLFRERVNFDVDGTRS